MAVVAVELMSGRLCPAPVADKVEPPVPIPLEAIARVLAGLLRRDVSPAEVRDRAVGLGLLRLSESGRRPALAAAAASRLFLAGYRLPAHVEPTTPPALRRHCEAGRSVFVILSAAEDPEVVAAGDVVPSDWLVEVWSRSRSPMAVAATRWADLPASGTTFFGGGRDRDGTYHWNVAECDTDATGRILRCW